MATKEPKVLLFDMGGVCVVSPFQAILDYELGLGIPPGWINYSISQTAPNGFWHKLERGEIPLGQDFYDGFNYDLHDPHRWRLFYAREQAKDPNLPRDIPPVPIMDGEWLFTEMMASSAAPDPWMFPALKRLHASGKYILAALSNTVIFPPGHPLHVHNFLDDPLRSLFDIFVSSAHEGLRKPDPRMYRLALDKVDRWAREHSTDARAAGKGWESGVQPGEVLFLDDIGENLKGARELGFGTIKVPLGRAYEAVEQLEKVTGLELEGNHAKVPIEPRIRRPSRM